MKKANGPKKIITPLMTMPQAAGKNVKNTVPPVLGGHYYMLGRGGGQDHVNVCKGTWNKDT